MKSFRISFLLAFCFLIYESCTKNSVTNSPRDQPVSDYEIVLKAMKDFNSASKSFVNPKVEIIQNKDLEQRVALVPSEDCCAILGQIRPHYPGILINCNEFATGNKLAFHLIYYNPSAPVYNGNNMYFLSTSTPRPCDFSISYYTINLGQAPPGYYMAVSWIGTTTDNFDMCNFFISNYYYRQ